MKKKTNLNRIIILVSIVLIAFLIINIVVSKPTHADSGFSTSYGGSSSSSGSSSSGGSESGGGGDPGVALILGVAFFGILGAFGLYFHVADKIEKNKEEQERIKAENIAKQYIPNFNKDEFLLNVYNMYCNIQVAWMNFKLEDVKDIITDELYTMYESQLATLTAKGEQNIMKDFNLSRSWMKRTVVENNTITITTGHIIQCFDYIINQTTGEVVRGDKDHKLNIIYEMEFRKTLDQNKKIDKCPNCGAQVDVNSSGICLFCRTKLVTENINWVLTQKKVQYQSIIYNNNN